MQERHAKQPAKKEPHSMGQHWFRKSVVVEGQVLFRAMIQIGISLVALTAIDHTQEKHAHTATRRQLCKTNKTRSMALSTDRYHYKYTQKTDEKIGTEDQW